MLIGTEAMLRACGDERRMPVPKLQLMSIDVEHPASLEDDVEALVGVHGLIVRLRRDERVDAYLKTWRLVHDLASTLSGTETCFDSGDVECVSRLKRFSMRTAG